VGVLIYQLPGSNQLKTAGFVKRAMADMAKSFPPGMEYVLPYDTKNHALAAKRRLKTA